MRQRLNFKHLTEVLSELLKLQCFPLFFSCLAFCYSGLNMFCFTLLSSKFQAQFQVFVSGADLAPF